MKSKLSANLKRSLSVTRRGQENRGPRNCSDSMRHGSRLTLLSLVRKQPSTAPRRHTGEKPAPYSDTGPVSSPHALGFQSTPERRGAHTFIPLCGLRKAIVILRSAATKNLQPLCTQGRPLMTRVNSSLRWRCVRNDTWAGPPNSWTLNSHGPARVEALSTLCRL